jgi:hypothetical protein
MAKCCWPLSVHAPTLQPLVMTAAARNPRKRSLRVAPRAKRPFAPGSPAVMGCLARVGLLEPLEALGFAVAAYGCTTCLGHLGPLDPPRTDPPCLPERRRLKVGVDRGNVRMNRRSFLVSAAALAVTPALAQLDYPSRPIRLGELIRKVGVRLD